MIPAQALIDGFQRNTRYMSRLLDGVTHSESLVQPGSAANCLNWTFGHMVEYRNVILHLLDRPGVGDPGQLDRYLRESDPIRADGPGVVPLDTLVRWYAESEHEIASRLGTMSAADWAAETAAGDRVTTVADRLTFLYFHETFHLGQADVEAALIRV